MHRQWTKWLVGLTVMAVLLMVGLTALAANTQHQLSVAPQHNGRPSTGVKQAAGNVPSELPMPNMSPATKNIVDQLRAKGSKALHALPKPKFKAPAYRMFADMAASAGINVPESVKLHPESLCPTYSGWMAGPAMTSNTNGTAMVWGGGENIYFASASDPTHPFVLPWGDYALRVTFQGNIAIVLSLFYTYEFDVTDPVNPAFIGYDYGIYGNMTGFYMTPDGQYIVGLYYGDDVVFFDGGLNYIMDSDLESIYGPTFPWSFSPRLTDLVIPDTPGSVVVITDWRNDYIHFIDLSGLACSAAPYVNYLGFIDDTIYGNQDCAQIMYQAPYLYTVYEPWFNYQPFVMNNCPDNVYYIDIFSVPDVATPANFISVKYWYSNNAGNDVVAIRPAGNGRVGLGLYNGQTAIWDAQGNTLLEWGTMGRFGSDAFGFGWCSGIAPNWEYFSLDMGYSPTTGGITADWAGGVRFFGPHPTPETGYYLTGDWASNAIAVGSTLYVPDYATGMAIVNGTDPTNPTTIGWLPSIPSLPFIGLVSVTGTTAFVAADYSTTYTKVYAADISNPAAPTYLSTSATAFDITAAPGYGTQIQTLAANGGICWIGTDTHIVGVDFSNPAAPAVVASFAAFYGGPLQLTTFVHPGFPLSTFLAAAEGPGFEVFDITVPVGTAPCPTPYFLVGQMASPTAGQITQIFATGHYLVMNDTTNGWVSSVGVDGNIPGACGFGELTLGSTVSNLYTGGDVWPYGIAFAGQIGTSVVGAISDGWTYLTIFNLTDPTNIGYFTTPPQRVWNYNFPYPNYGLVYCNGGLYYDNGYGGLNNYALKAGFYPPVVNSVSVSTPSPATYLPTTTTVTVKVTAADSAINEVDIYFMGYTVAVIPTSVPAGTSKTLTYTWDTTKWRHRTACGPDDVTAQAFDDGCNESAVVGTGAGPYNISQLPKITIGNYNPAIPAGSGCNPVAGQWIVCGTLTFDVCATDGPCNYNTGITQTALYLDSFDKNNITANLITFLNVTLPCPWSVTFDTTTISDGPHTIIAVAWDNSGLLGTKSTPIFTVHNVGPVTTLVAPLAGNVVSGTAIPVRATCVSAGSNLPIAKVEFWLDFFSSAVLKIGTATAPDADGLFSIAWDATATGTNTPYGDHTLTAIGFDGTGACVATYVSPLVSFHLIQYTPPTITATATPTSGNIPLSVAFAANVTNGSAPFTYAWTFGDGNTGSGQATTHTYTTAGTFNWSVTVTDAMGSHATASGSVTAINPVVPPTVTSVQKASNPFRLKIYGSNFHPGCTVRINGVAVPLTTFKSSGLLVAKKGAALKAMVPKGVTVQISVKNNDDGGVSANFSYTR